MGVRKSSTPAEIRLAYRIRRLELKANGGESNRSLQAQLARGFETLLELELRESFFSLLENPEANIAFPPWTVGCLLALGQKKDDLFMVRDFVGFVPRAEDRTPRLPLRRFRFDDGIYRDARKRTIIRFDSAVLPVEWTNEWNTWAHLALGSMTVKARFWQQTRFRRTEAGRDLRRVQRWRELAHRCSVQVQRTGL